MLINAGIRTIYYANGYPDSMSRDMLAEAGIDLIEFNKTISRPFEIQ
jgi:dCMP deaminase